MISPSDPGVSGVEGGMHDGMKDEGHRAQFDHADKGGKSIKDQDEHED